MTNAELVDTWRREAVTAIGEAGAVKHLWEVAGSASCSPWSTCPHPRISTGAGRPADHPRDGSGVVTQTRAIHEYTTFAADLEAGAHG